MKCKRYNNPETRRSRRRGIEWVLSTFGVYPFRREWCRTRSFVRHKGGEEQRVDS